MRDSRIRHEFRSILNILIHFSFSLTQLVCVFGILALQIVLTVTQTCAYPIGIGFWSFPFLLIAPITIWIVLWRRTSISCLIAILIHFCSTLFATAIIIVSFLVFIGQIGFVCPTSSLNVYYIGLHSSLIGVAALLKLSNYGEICLLYMLIKDNHETSTKIIEESDYPSAPDNVNVWRSWSAVANETRRNSDDIFV
jgi:hypothetical protein